MSPAPGFLAIWSDIAPEHETDYLHWLTREHTAERVSIPGFQGVRVFRAASDGFRRYFILYELESAIVVGSPAYLARLNAPTAWSTRIMPQLGGFRRGGGSLGRRCGAGAGGVIAVAIVDGEAEIAALEIVSPYWPQWIASAQHAPCSSMPAAPASRRERRTCATMMDNSVGCS